ncbi:MAG: chemotaxis protein CheX [Desulfobacula sp.]|nr:chemotaxis protein CheX [Desulfobacula sp.]
MMKTIMTAMKTSISEVMETMFFLPVEFVDEPALKQIKALKGKKGKACRLDFSGDCSGSVILLTPRQLLMEMAENFMGESGESMKEDLLDGTLAEAVNMMAGNALRKIKTKVPFELSIPKLVPGTEFPENEGTLIINTTGPEMAVHITLG